MSEPIDSMVAALARERDGYIRSGRPDRAIPVDEQLARRGYCVNDAGDLVKLDEQGEAPDTTPPRGRSAKPQETTAVEPRRRGRPRHDAAAEGSDGD